MKTKLLMMVLSLAGELIVAYWRRRMSEQKVAAVKEKVAETREVILKAPPSDFRREGW